MLGRTMLTGMTALSAGACTAPATEPDFDAAAPAPRLLAIQQAGAQRDAAATRSLIEQLDSDDPAVRMLAFEALRRLEGDEHGFHHGDPAPARRDAIAIWAGRHAARPAASDEDG